MDYHCYQKLQLQLAIISEFLPTFPQEKEVLEQEMISLQNLMTKELLSLEAEQMELNLRAKWQSIHTEIWRSYRLLTTDFLFLKTAKQVNLISQRLNSIQQRLKELNSLCEMILNVEQS